jgi:hypothetical protein
MEEDSGMLMSSVAINVHLCGQEWGKGGQWGLSKETKNKAVDSERGTGKGGNPQLRTKSQNSSKKVFFTFSNTTHANSFMYVLTMLLVLKKIYSLVCRLKINHVMEIRNMYLFLAQ